MVLGSKGGGDVLQQEDVPLSDECAGVSSEHGESVEQGLRECIWDGVSIYQHLVRTSDGDKDK